MTPVEPLHPYGSIVIVADMLDPQGRNPKDRPCVIMTAPGETPDGRELVVAISTVLPDPLPDDYVPLPYMNPRHPRTGLNKRNAAIGRWIEEIDGSRIIRKLGIVPTKQLVALTDILDRRDASEHGSASDRPENGR